MSGKSYLPEKRKFCSVSEYGFEPRGLLRSIYCWLCAADISEPLPHYSVFLVYFVANYKSHYWANNFLTLKLPKKFDPIIVSPVVKMRPHPAGLHQ